MRRLKKFSFDELQFFLLRVNQVTKFFIAISASDRLCNTPDTGSNDAKKENRNLSFEKPNSSAMPPVSYEF